MTPARNPLVREIEEAAVRGFVEGASPDDWEAYITTSSNRYRRIRAALEAAEEMAANAPCAIAAPSLWLAAKRYRAATRETP